MAFVQNEATGIDEPGHCCQIRIRRSPGIREFLYRGKLALTGGRILPVKKVRQWRTTGAMPQKQGHRDSFIRVGAADQLASGDEGALTACNRLISSGNCHSCVLGMLSSLEVKVLCPT